MTNASTSSITELTIDARRLLDRDFLYEDPASYRAGVLAVLEALQSPTHQPVPVNA